MSVIAQVKALQNQGKHEDALVVIGREIEEQPLRQHLRLKPVDMFDLLETRAYSFEKLRKWNSAKADAAQMIKIKPEDPRGYLRKGHIYFENGHFGRAAQVYRMALNRVEKSSKIYERLSKTYTKLKIMAQTNFVDPVGRLPPEILNYIFQQSIASTHDIVRLMLVSKAWFNYFESWPHFWTNLNFTGPEYISHQTLDRFMARSGNHGLHLRVSRPVRKSDRFPKMLKKYKELKTLYFDTSGLLLDNLVQEQVQLDRLVTLKMPVTRLEKMLVWCLESLPSLESVELNQSAVGTVPPLEITECTIKAPLQHLTIVGNSYTQPCLKKELVEFIYNQTPLKTLVMHRVLPEIAPLAQALTGDAESSRQVSRFGYTSCSPRAYESQMNTHISLPLVHLSLNKVNFVCEQRQPPLCLEYLEVKWSQLDPEWGISSLISHFGCADTLENLILERNTLRYGLAPGSEPQVYPRLRNLYLVAMPIPVTSSFIEWICGSMPLLEFINLNETPIDGLRIVKLVEHGLKHIRCRNPGSIDPATLKWANERGTRVTIN